MTKQTAWIVGAIIVGAVIIGASVAASGPEQPSGPAPVFVPEDPYDALQEYEEGVQEQQQQAQLDCLAKGWEWRFGACYPPTATEVAPEQVPGNGIMFQTLCEERGHHWVDGFPGYCVD